MSEQKEPKRGRITHEDWHLFGVECDEQIVMRPETQTIDQILADDNIERMMIRIERYGQDKFFSEVEGDVLDERTNDIDNTKEKLIAFKSKSSTEKHKALLVTCPTGRFFAIPFPVDSDVNMAASITTCEDAQKFLTGEDTLPSWAQGGMAIGRS